jgi:hypothetical protein
MHHPGSLALAESQLEPQSRAESSFAGENTPSADYALSSDRKTAAAGGHRDAWSDRRPAWASKTRQLFCLTGSTLPGPGQAGVNDMARAAKMLAAFICPPPERRRGVIVCCLARSVRSFSPMK